MKICHPVVHTNPVPSTFDEIIAQAKEKARRVRTQMSNENRVYANESTMLGQFQNLARATTQISGSVANCKL